MTTGCIRDALTFHTVARKAFLEDLKPFVAPGNASHETCKQVAAVFPTKHASLDRSLGELYSTPAFKLDAIDSLSQLIRVP